MGIIDTLTAGFDRVTRHLWLILFPSLVDVAIWAGPKLSIQRLSQQAIAALPTVAELGTQYQQSLELFQDLVSSVGAGVNLLSLLSMRLLGLPSLAGTADLHSAPLASAQRIIEIQSWPQLAIATLAIGLLGLLIGCFCLSCMAQDVRDEQFSLPRALTLSGQSWLRLVALGVATGLLVVGALLAISLGYTVLALLSPQLAAVGMSLLAIASLWVSAYASIAFFFIVRTLFVSNSGLLRSVAGGLRILHRSFLSAIGFLILFNVIQAGLAYIWRELAVNTAGTLVGIVGNAYVSSGLVMASLIFCRDRFVAWQEASQRALNNKGQS